MQQMIIDPNKSNLPIGGKIRPGIKVPTKATAENQQASQIYRTMEAAGEPDSTDKTKIEDLIFFE